MGAAGDPSRLAALEEENAQLRAVIAGLQEELSRAQSTLAAAAPFGSEPRSASGGPLHGAASSADGAHPPAANAAASPAAPAAAGSSQQPVSGDADHQPPQPLARTLGLQPYAPEHGLTKAQVERYSRQLLLPSFGVAYQARLCAARVCIVGCGGLGAPAALYLAAAGGQARVPRAEG